MLLKNKLLKPYLLNNYKRSFLVIFFLLFCGVNIFANTNSKLVNDFINENKEILEPATINKNYLRKTKTVKTHDRQVLQVVNKVLQAEAYSKNFDNINSESISLYLEALSEAEKINDENLLVYVNTQVGFFYYSYNEYIKAMPFFIKSSNLLDKSTIDNLIQPADVYKKNAYFFGSINQHQKSIDYLLKALKYTPSNDKLYATFLNNIGSSYYKMGALENARNYFIKAQKVSLENNFEVRYAKVLGDLALIHFDAKEYQKAITLLQQDIELSKKNKSDRNTMYAQILLSKVYVETNEFSKAKQTLALANEYVLSKEYLTSHAYEIAEVNLQIALKTNDTVLELQARRALDVLGADIVNKDGEEAIKLVGWETQKEQFNTKLEAEKAKVEQANLKVLIICGIVIFIIVVTIFIVRSIQFRFKNKEAQYENNILQYKINQLQSKSKLDDYDLTLKSYQTYLSDQNKQMDLIEQELDKLNTNTVSKDQAKLFLQELLDQQKMSGTNWLALKNTFLKEENDYYNALLENFPDLSELNLRIVILNKMDLKPAEIALVLNIKIDVVNNALQRLRKNFKGRFDKHSIN
ncbi:Tetratricopeptide repeat-containing protein [Paenimyroides ummariense]|uniref:Tetratricopeptide repeat-containing protein n=1 Tax=Paenimyroides ummariense TaxID=913024 RepID=A0A1I5BRX7_9FLAO|nr:tetratricopeptide repeat protein [Paenimyroides ummariense]SFN77459.1 Tetratricopeptide repeat-containing protein [Paenimyroides ummariense]